MAKFFLCALFFLLPVFSKAQFFSEQQEKLHKQVLALSIDDSHVALASDKSAKGQYLLCLSSFLKALIEGNPNYSSTFFTISDKALDLANDLESDRDRMLISGHTRFFQAFINFRDGHHISAAYDFLKAYYAAKDLAEDYPNFIDAYPLRILVEGMLASLPENIADQLAFLGFEGDKQKAMQLLNELEQKAEEKKYAYLFVYSFFLEDYIALQYDRNSFSSRNLPKSLSDHPLVLTYKSTFYSNAFQAEKALSYIERVPIEDLAIKPIVLYYFKGKSLLFLRDEKAHYPLKRFLDLNQGEDFVKSAYLYLSYHYFLEGNMDLSKFYQAQIPKHGAARTGFDAYAQQSKDKSFRRELIIAEVLFDGGSYQQLNSFLTQVDESSWQHEADKVELNYRRARLAQKRGEREKAMKYFGVVVAAEDDVQVYMQANSYLQMATLYAEAEECSKAIAQAKKSLDFKSYPYSEGLKFEAKAVIRNCSN